MRYKFQIENGYIAEGNLEIIVRDHIAEIDGLAPSELAPAMRLLIEANGGEVLTEERKSKPRRDKKEVKNDSAST